MTKPRAMNWEDRAIAAMGIGAGILVGIVIMTLAALVFQGFWILLVIALPFLILQLFFEGAIRLVWHLGRRMFGYHAAADVPEPAPDLTIPWFRRYSFTIGMTIGALAVYIFSDVWSFS